MTQTTVANLDPGRTSWTSPRGQTTHGYDAAVSAGDVNGDGFADLTVGVPGEDVGATSEAGAFW